MAAALRVDVAPEDWTIAESAAYWCEQFHPRVSATVRSDCILLSSDSANEVEIEAAWLSALCNELLYRDQEDFRAVVLERLAE